MQCWLPRSVCCWLLVCTGAWACPVAAIHLRSSSAHMLGWAAASAQFHTVLLQAHVSHHAAEDQLHQSGGAGSCQSG